MQYSGTVRLPAPCYILQDDTKVLGSSAEQVEIRLSVLAPLPNAGLCIQTVTEEEFSGEVKVSKDATVTIFLNDVQVN